MGYLDPGAGHAGTPDAQRLRDGDAAAWGYVPNFTTLFSLRPAAYRAWRQLNGAIRDAMTTCLAATGTQTDAAFARLNPQLRDALTVGRPIERRVKWLAPGRRRPHHRPMDLPEAIDAGKLVLKRWRPAYAEAATRAVRESLPQLEPFMPWAHDGYDLAESRSFIERSADEWAEGIAFNYAVFTAADELVGSCGLMTRMGASTLEIGYWIHSGHTGRGYASAAVSAVTRVGLGLPGIERMVIRHDAANPASGAVAAKAGFRQVERVHRDPEAPGETGVDVIWERRAPIPTPAER